MTTDQQIILLRIFHEVDILLGHELNKLLDSGIEPDTYGNHPDKRWQVLRDIQLDKENFQDSYKVLGKDEWSFESKLKVGIKRKEELLDRIVRYKEMYWE